MQKVIDISKKDAQEKRRRKRELWIVFAVSLLLVGLTFFEIHYQKYAAEIPLSNNIILVTLANVDIILTLLLIFLITRNFVKLFFEKKRKVLGAKLRTKLVFAFISLSLIPAILLFIASVGIVRNSTKKWFRTQVESSLAGALEVAQIYYKDKAESVVHFTSQFSKNPDFIRNTFTGDLDERQAYLQKLISIEHLSAVMIFDTKLKLVQKGIDTTLPGEALSPPPKDILTLAWKKGKRFSYSTALSSGQIIYGIAPMQLPLPPHRAILVTSYYIREDLVKKMQEISRAYLEYKQLKVLKNPVKTIYLLSLLLVTLLVLFSATWFGLYFSKLITVPIQELAQATEEISKGNLDFQLKIKTRDEIAMLVDAFNRMTSDLKTSKEQIEETTHNLKNANVELDQRRRYMEVVLQNIATGVVSINKDECLSTINKYAATLFTIDVWKVMGKRLDEVLQEPYKSMAMSLLKEARENPKGWVERQIDLPIGKKLITLRTNVTVLREEKGAYLGVVAVFEDLTQMVKAQRMIAWREVARRIAHEIKNPLTPIKLSAQRLKKKYTMLYEENGGAFSECTNTIIQQADVLKGLVNEFSHFARMPEANPKPDSLNAIILDALQAYMEGHRDIIFETNLLDDIPTMNLDRGQITRVLTNLINNSIAAMDGKGTITISTHFNRILKIVKLSISDTGPGIPDKDKSRLFEPYFSTKKSGTGLGLTIVNTIINDHNGYIRVKDNKPEGTVFEIEFPV
jgi:two-component system nitrogen regulation sensor histidine kinase NtrY